jgi:hypothetical protein
MQSRYFLLAILNFAIVGVLVHLTFLGRISEDLDGKIPQWKDVHNNTETPQILPVQIQLEVSHRVSLQPKTKSFNERIEIAKTAFKNHPSHSAQKGLTLENHISYLATRQECKGKPIFFTMARVSENIYWQLIENFFYTMYMFHLSVYS